jgi:DNA-binding transcriptional MerR regulator
LKAQDPFEEAHVRIGELGRLSGLSAATIRYYERRGLLRPAERTPSGYRSYPAEAGLQLRLIRWAKSVGFTLREIRELLQLVHQHASRPTDRVRSRFDAKLREVERRMEDLAAMHKQLQALAQCHCQGACPIISRVVGEDPRASKPRRS